MPNYCNNSLRVKGSTEALDAVERVLEVFRIERKYDGCLPPRWEIDSIDRDLDVLFAHGPSAWRPPDEMLFDISKRYDVFIYNQYSEPGLSFAGHTYYERGERFDFCCDLYQYFYFNDINEFQYHLANLVMEMGPDKTFEDAESIIFGGWDVAKPVDDVKQMFNEIKKRIYE